jgi:hypothetical protein
VKRSDLVPHVDQVMSQVELSPFHGPQSPLDLVASEIVFGCMFKAFRRMSQAKPTAVRSVSGDDDRPAQKRHHRALLAKKTAVPR